MILFAPRKNQDLVEYAIILALIAIVVIAVMTTLSKKVNNTFNSIGDSPGRIILRFFSKMEGLPRIGLSLLKIWLAKHYVDVL